MKKYIKRIAAFMMALAIVAICMPITNVSAASTVTLTLRSGNVGSFNVSLLEANANDNVEITTDYIKITVAKDAAGESVESIFAKGFNTTAIDTVIAAGTVHDGYALLKTDKWGLNPTDKIRHNKEYVLEYGMLVDPVMYTIRFVEAADMNNEIAAPIINYGNAGDSIEVSAPTVSNYEARVKNDTLVLDKNSENIYTVLYDFTGQEGETTVLVPGNSGTASTNAPAAQGGEAAQATPEQGVAEPTVEENDEAIANDIADEDTPLSGGTTNIGDDAVPLAPGNDGGTNYTPYYIAGGVVAGAAVIGGIIFGVARKKKRG